MNFATEKADIWNKTDFSLEKAKKPRFRPTFPIPLLFTPPNNKYGFEYCNIHSLIATVPEEVDLIICEILDFDLVNKYNASAFSLELIKSITSSKSVYFKIGKIGPKISLFKIGLDQFFNWIKVNGKLLFWLDFGDW